MRKNTCVFIKADGKRCLRFPKLINNGGNGKHCNTHLADEDGVLLKQEEAPTVKQSAPHSDDGHASMDHEEDVAPPSVKVVEDSSETKESIEAGALVDRKMELEALKSQLDFKFQNSDLWECTYGGCRTQNSTLVCNIVNGICVQHNNSATHGDGLNYYCKSLNGTCCLSCARSRYNTV